MFFRVQEFPITPFQEIDAEMRGLLRELTSGGIRGTNRMVPPIEVSESTSEYEITLEAPGLTKSDVSVSVKEGVVTIRGERKPAAVPEDAKWLRNEIPTGEFTRTVRLPGEIDPKGCTAEMTNGVLRIHLAKSERMVQREITVK